MPLVATVTHEKQSILRLHGRNYDGWLGADDSQDWRQVRTLYQYSPDELNNFKDITLTLADASENVAVIFNNNSGGHAGPNAKEFQALLGIQYEGLAFRQLDLF